MESSETASTQSLSTLARVALAGVICVATCGLASIGIQAAFGTDDDAVLWLPFDWPEEVAVNAVSSGGDDAAPSLTPITSPTTTVTSPTTTVTSLDDSLSVNLEKKPTTTVKASSTEESTDETDEKDVTTTAAIQEAFLEISSPEDGSAQDSKHVTIQGTATPGTDVYAGPYKADMDGEGNWTIKLILSPGKNNAQLKAKNGEGAVLATANVTVTYDAPVPTTTTPPAVSFTAHQKYGSCSEVEPYDKFYGTGQPGTVVNINSPYGSGSTTVDSKGNWLKKVYFPSAPANQAFVVNVAGTNGSATFEFIHSVPDYPETVEFSAGQEIGVSDADWAYDYFYGTTNPNTTVNITSAYGSVTTQSDAWGNFEKKLIFEGLPAGESVAVTVQAVNGSKTLTFTWVPPVD